MFNQIFKSALSRPKSQLWSGVAILGVVGVLGATRIPGVVQGFGNLKNDGIVDAALVVPSLTAEQILAFEIGDLMAPNEKLSAGPVDANVPGNTFVPEQQESYGIFPITIVKNEFGYYPKTDNETELASYWASAPFGELVSKIRNKAPYKEILELVTFKRFGLTDKRDWSRVTKITTQLDRLPQTLGNYTWNRGSARANEVDLVISFQETPNARWMLGGLDAKSASKGTVNGVAGMTGLTKALFLRVINDANNSPIGGRGYFRNHSAESPGNFVVDGVPAALEGLKLDDKKTVRWTDPKVTGWIGVFRATKSSRVNLFHKLESELSSLSNDLSHKTIEQWVPATAETFELDTPLKDNEELVVVFVGGTDSELTQLNPGKGEDRLAPVLETATEVRLSRLK